MESFWLAETLKWVCEFATRWVLALHEMHSTVQVLLLALFGAIRDPLA
jgi:hypothetical protein